MAVPAKGGASSEDQSLDDIFQEFKKGVEAQAGREDTDTHYNLGIAYKEMGLLDEAIGEFLLTPEGEPKFIQSRYMLGLCYMEMGDFRKATVEIGNALNYSESLASDAEDRLSMNYDLGLAYQGAGEMSNALGQFQKVSAEAPGFPGRRSEDPGAPAGRFYFPGPAQGRHRKRNLRQVLRGRRENRTRRKDQKKRKGQKLIPA